MRFAQERIGESKAKVGERWMRVGKRKTMCIFAPQIVLSFLLSRRGKSGQHRATCFLTERLQRKLGTESATENNYSNVLGKR